MGWSGNGIAVTAQWRSGSVRNVSMASVNTSFSHSKYMYWKVNTLTSESTLHESSSILIGLITH